MIKQFGIINVTPDSFSGDGIMNDIYAVIRKIDEHAMSGAYGIDIGGQSTRPGATRITCNEEMNRLDRILRLAIKHAKKLGLSISIDTFYSEIARFAIDLGANYLNDVSGFEGKSMCDILVENKCIKGIMMHSLSVPSDRSITIADDLDVINEILEWGKARIDALLTYGVRIEQIILDPGIGFGKTHQQSWEIMERLNELTALGVQVYAGYSRKRFLQTRSAISDIDLLKICKSCHYARVHNVVKL